MGKHAVNRMRAKQKIRFSKRGLSFNKAEAALFTHSFSACHLSVSDCSVFV